MVLDYFVGDIGALVVQIAESERSKENENIAVFWLVHGTRQFNHEHDKTNNERIIYLDIIMRYFTPGTVSPPAFM
jgi:hypothetical protein